MQCPLLLNRAPEDERLEIANAYEQRYQRKYIGAEVVCNSQYFIDSMRIFAIILQQLQGRAVLMRLLV